MAFRKFRANPKDNPSFHPVSTTAGYVIRVAGGAGPTKAAMIQWDDTRPEHEILAAVDKAIAYLAAIGRDNLGNYLP